MAMAHPNPGLGKRKMTRHYDPFRRVTSAPPDLIRLKQVIRPLHGNTIDSIRVRKKRNAELKTCYKKSVTRQVTMKFTE